MDIPPDTMTVIKNQPPAYTKEGNDWEKQEQATKEPPLVDMPRPQDWFMPRLNTHTHII